MSKRNRLPRKWPCSLLIHQSGPQASLVGCSCGRKMNPTGSRGLRIKTAVGVGVGVLGLALAGGVDIITNKVLCQGKMVHQWEQKGAETSKRSPQRKLGNEGHF